MKFSPGVLTCALLAALGSCKKEAAKSPPAETPTVASGSANEGSGDDNDQVKAKSAKKPGKAGAEALVDNEVVAPTGGGVEGEQADRGHMSLAFEGKDSPARAIVRSTGAFDKLIPELDKAINLPNNLPITFKKCDEVNAFYDPEAIAITMCDEMVDFYGELFAEYEDEDRTQAAVGALVAVFLHELGHALIDQLQLPAVGKQEDAVDQLSTVVLVASGDEGNQMALDGAYSWVAEGDAQGEDETPFWDVHSLNEQRFYNIMCLIYGSSPEDYKEVITEEELPNERAEGCEQEYAEISSSWNALLEPHLSVPVMQVDLAK